jgi:haloalkane dehalogenase
MTTMQPDNQTTILRPEWLSERAWPFEIRTALIGGTPIAFTDEGSGPTLLLVHDGMCSYLWVHLIQLLRDRFRVVTLDFPGSGLSPEGALRPGLETDSRILEGLVAHLDLTDLTLVVHDLGGGVGLGLATRHPDLIAGLALINTFAWPATTPGLRGMLRLMGSPLMTAINSRTNLVARATSGRFGVGRHFDREQKDAFLAMFRHKTSRQRFNSLIASAITESEYLSGVEGRLDQLAAKPALMIFGKRNDPFRFQGKWRAHFPDVEQMVIQGGYHFPMCDDPDGVAERIALWRGNR